MTEQKLLFIDIKPVEASADQQLWTRSENSFRFNFFPENSTGIQQPAPPSSEAEAGGSSTGTGGSSAGGGHAFAFNFQVPPVDNDQEDMTPEAAGRVLQEDPEGSTPDPSKTKKKKKKKKKEEAAAQQEPRPPGGDTQLSAEKQLDGQPGGQLDTQNASTLDRQLDWCIEQLEAGMRSQKITIRQKEDASRALKTLRSSKAPLVKKRQVMRSMTGDYRKKMEEEKSKQFKMIQSEMASARVKAVSNSPKKSVFLRRADVGVQTPAEAQETDRKDQQETADFVFTPAKEEFRFNFF